MFIKTVKVKKPKVLYIALTLIVAAIIALLIMLGCSLSSKSNLEMKSETQRQAFLKKMGWEVSDEYDECKVVEIPAKFNEVYENYNKLQKEQGFDLLKFAGKSVEVYTYKVSNYYSGKDKNKDEDIECHLMVCEGQLIGGDVCSQAVDGFMQGLKKDTSQKSK